MSCSEWILLITISYFNMWSDYVQSCSIYIPKAHTRGVLTNPSYPYPEYTVRSCQYVFDMYTTRPQLNSMVCLTFQRFNMPTEYPNVCSSNYLKFGVTKGAIICGNMTNLTIQYMGGTGPDASDNTNVKVKWPTICYSDSHVLELAYRISQQSFFATYQQYIFPMNLQCNVPKQCTNCTTDLSEELTDCPTCVCPTNSTAEDPVSDFGCNFTTSVCSLTPDRYSRWRFVQAAGPSGLRGPNWDHTAGKFFSYPNVAGYMYLVEIEMYRGETAFLLLPSITINTTHCLQFWYYMSLSHVGRLDLLLDDHVTWYREGDQGPTWRQAQVLLLPWKNPDTQEYSEQTVKLRGTARYQSPDFGGISIDDISLQSGICHNRQDMSCTFENGLCGWTTTGDVMVKSGRVSDHTEQSFTRKTLHVSSRVNEYVTLASPYVTERVRLDRCLTFWYHPLTGDIMGVVNLRAIQTYSSFNLHVGRFWIQGHGWTKIEMSLFSLSSMPTSQNAFQIEIKFENLNSQLDATALLDDIQLKDDVCPSATTSTPTISTPPCAVDGQLRCGGISSECIYQNQLCDGRDDCIDGWDELKNRCTCSFGEFRCQRGGCINSEYRCDNVIHCRDGSDEALYARCDQGSALSVGAIIGSSFGVMCLCVLLITLCVWGCIYAKGRRLRSESRFTPRRPRSLHEMGIEPYMIDCPEAPPNYFSVVNYGFEPPVEPPPSYESIVGLPSETDFNIPRLSLSSLGFPVTLSFRELLSRASLSSQERRERRTSSERTEPGTDIGPVTSLPLAPPAYVRAPPIGGTDSPLPKSADEPGTPTPTDSPPPPIRIPPLPPRAPPPMRLTAHLRRQSDLSQASFERTEPEPERQPSWRLAVARRLSESVRRLPPPDIVSDVTEIPASGDTFV